MAVGTKFGDDVATYIKDIDPIYWNVFANIQMEVIDENVIVKNFTTSSTDSGAHHKLCRKR